MTFDPTTTMDPETARLAGDQQQLELLRRGEHHSPHSILGAHPAEFDGQRGVVLRTFHPDAVSCECLLAGRQPLSMRPVGYGVFALFLPGVEQPPRFSVRFHFATGGVWERGEPYCYLPTLGDVDLHLIGEGNHRRLWEVLGAQPRTVDGVEGTSFAVWAPNAVRVSVIGEFCSWDGRLLPMRSMGGSGVWELFLPGVGPGDLYKFELKAQNGDLRVKTDPLARAMELPPAQASIVARSEHGWGDAVWMNRRAREDIRRAPVSIYEVHLGSWARVPEEDNRYLSYRELAPRLVAHAKHFGFTHLELMPIAEHAYFPSWGYQVTGYYAPTSRYGSPDDFRWFVDYCHQNGVGIIVDWVPAHFPKDDFSLRRFDGSALYEHEDSRRGEHPDWGTMIFNYGRAEVKNFLVANALYWLQEFHVDALRVDAVASMLYLDYSRKEGEWIPNPYGGRENIEAIDFLRQFNWTVSEEVPGAFTIAEESTSWGGVSNRVEWGGLGFTFKWNMGWMHDTLEFFKKDPIHRRFHVDQLTFSMVYEYTERFINSISHDEVVHGKGALIEKMPGDFWQKMANLKLLMAYQYTRPGKQLMFMGTEIGQHHEWNHESSLDWHIAEHPQRQGLQKFLVDLGQFYLHTPCLWRSDPQPESFEWIDFNDRDNTILSYMRRDGGEHAIVVLNFTPVAREAYRIGAPQAGRYRVALSSDAEVYSGSGFGSDTVVGTEAIPTHGRENSLLLRIPPLCALVLVPEK
jgi:1,4-alpha-glucan branching enzyme